MSLTFTYHLAQACLNGYTGYLSHNAIWRLRQYEETTEKAAKWSGTAAEQLHKTRTTQTAGAISILASLGSSLYLVYASSKEETSIPLLLCVANSISLSATYQYMSNFWQHKAKLPLAKEYNEAIDLSNVYRQFLIGLALSWWAAAAYYIPMLMLR